MNANLSQQKSTQINTSLTRVNTNQHKFATSKHQSVPVNTSQQESTRVNMSQSDQEFIMFYCSLVGKV